jgi:TolA-binding protein
MRTQRSLHCSTGTCVAVAAVAAWAVAPALAKKPTAQSSATVAPVTDVASPGSAALATAHGLLGRGLYDLAAEEYRRFLKDAPAGDDERLARYGLGVCAYRQKQFAEAVEAFTALAALDGFPYMPDVLAMLGRARLETGQFSDARTAFDQLLAEFPDHALAENAGAGGIEASYRLGEQAETRRRAREFVARYPQSPNLAAARFYGAAAALAENDAAEAAATFAELLPGTTDPAFGAQIRLYWADALARLDRTGDAAEQYSAITKDADSSLRDEALLRLAAIKIRGGDSAQAGTLADELAARLPAGAQRSAAWRIAGRARFDAGDFGAARKAFTHALDDATPAEQAEAEYWQAKCDLRSGNAVEVASTLARLSAAPDAAGLRAEIRYDWAVALTQQDAFARAEEQLVALLTDTPEHALAADAAYLQAWCVYRRGAYADSAALCGKFLTEHADHAQAPSAAFLLAENAYLAEDWPSATTRFTAFIEKYRADARIPTAQLRLGLIAYRKGDTEVAESWLHQLSLAGDVAREFRPALLALGDIQFQKGRWTEAAALLQRYIDSGPADSSTGSALLKLAMSHESMAQPREAVAALDRLLESSPDPENRTRALFERGRLKRGMSDLVAADKDFAAAIELGADPTVLANAHLIRGVLARERGDENAAADHFAAAAQTPSSADSQGEAAFQQAQSLMALERFADAENLLADFASHYPAHARTGAAAAQRALAVSRQGRADEAAKLFAALEPSSANLDDATRAAVSYENAWTLRAQNDLPGARAAYAQLVDNLRADPALRGRGILELAELDMAERQFEPASERLERWRAEPTFASLPPELQSAAQARSGICLFELGRHADAAQRLSEISAENAAGPLAPQVGLYLGEAYSQLGQLEKAAAAFENLATRYPASPAGDLAQLRWGETLAALHMWVRSGEVLSAYLERDHDTAHTAQARFGLGWALENQQRYPEAMSAYARVASDRGPLAPRAQFQLGECLFAQDKSEAAATELLKVDILFAQPEWSAAALYEAGRCFEKLQRAEDARKQYAAVVERFADSSWARLAAEKLKTDQPAPSAARATIATGAMPAPAQP